MGRTLQELRGFQPGQKRNFTGTSTKEKLPGIKVLKVAFLKKVNLSFIFHFRFLCFMAYHKCGLFNAKAIHLEEQQWYYLTHSWEDKGGSYISQGF